MKSILFVAVATVFISSFPAQAQTTSDTNSNAQLLFQGHGVNLGDALEATGGEGKWGVVLQEKYFDAIEKIGFNLIRVPISWPQHAAMEAPYTIDPAFFQRVDWVVAQAKAHHLTAILDFHNFNEFAKDPAGHEDQFLALWKQVAEHYQSEPDSILFEILNEPADKLDAATWNAVVAKALPVIRASNPNRLIVIGGVHWNSIKALNDLVLPDNDRRIVVTFHDYDPMQFTHQGASWIEGSKPWLGTKWLGTDEEKKKISDAMDQAAAWGQAHQRPIYMGEFGSFQTGDMDSRVRWTQAMVQAANAHGFAWTYWEFCSGFGVYDPKTDQWREPLLHALLPDAKL